MATSIGEKALLLVLRDRITSRAEIARRLGVHRSTVARMKDLSEAIFFVEVLSGRHGPGARKDSHQE